jgi:hypothetical protein
MARIKRFGELVLSRVLPSATAEASQCCGGGCGYQFRCLSTGAFQQRYCCTDCQCRQSCGSWQTIPHQFC